MAHWRGVLRRTIAVSLGMILVAVIAVTNGSSPGHAAGDTDALEALEGDINTGIPAEVDPPPEVQTTTDPNSPELEIYEGEKLTGLLEDFDGLVYTTFFSEGQDLLDGTYIYYLLLFDSVGDAKKFRAADVKDVVGGGQLEKVGKYKNGAILDDGEGHINVMFNVENVVVDIRIGVTETQPGDGVDQIEDIAELIFKALGGVKSGV
jgi:hypothetical protein